jgi:hypothetical protein
MNRTVSTDVRDLLILAMICCSLTGCAHQKTLAEQELAADKATDADVREAVKRVLDLPEGSAFLAPPYEHLRILSAHHGRRIIEELLRQGTSRRTEYNSNDDPVMLVLSFERIRMLNGDDILEVGTDLMKSEDPHLKESAKELVQYLFELNGGEQEDTVEYLKKHQLDQNQELIELMFEVSPERAFRVMSDPALVPPEDSRKFQWAGHLIEEVAWREQNFFADRIPADEQAAAEQLRFLATRPEWWARYYAAYMMGNCEGLADPVTKERLKNDPDRRVREVIDPPPRIEPPEPEPEPPHTR